MALLEIKDLELSLGGKEILRGFNLSIKHGEVHAIMGPNGSGKSTLSYALSGRDSYEVSGGSIMLNGEDITEMATDKRARLGLFLALQYPIEISGVSSMVFLREAYNAHLRSKGLSDVDMLEFAKRVRERASKLGISTDMLKRSVNVGFSGGEKKRFDILQMIILEPAMCILDESDSGLDIDALKNVALGVNDMRDGLRSFLLITHYQRLLDYVEPDFVHIMADGRIIESGDKSLAHRLEKGGYAEFGIDKVV